MVDLDHSESFLRNYTASNLLYQEEKEQVRLGTLLAHRMAQALQIIHSQNKPGWVETPHQRPGKPSVFKLPHYQSLMQLPHVTISKLAQCPLGAPTEKLTDIICLLMSISSPDSCTHPQHWWRMPWNGEWHWGAHPPLRGKQWMVPSWDWKPGMRRWREPQGPYLTRGAAAYPSAMNKLIADEWVRASARIRLEVNQISSMVRTGKWANTLVRKTLVKDQVGVHTIKRPLAAETDAFQPTKVRLEDPVRPKDEERLPALYDEKACVCGLVNTWESMGKLPQHKALGPQLAAVIDKFLDGNKVLERDIFQSIGADKVDVPALSARLEPLRHLLAEELSARGTPSISEVEAATCSASIRGHLLAAWATMARDPAWKVCEWLFTGAPAGLERDYTVLDGLFPRVLRPDESDNVVDLETDYDSFTNYTGVEEDSDAADVIENYIRRKFLKSFSSLADTKKFVNGNPILNKLGLVVKNKTHPETGTVTKTIRIIVDNKQSGVSLIAKRTHRSTLPRAANAVQSVMGLMDATDPAEQFDAFIDLFGGRCFGRFLAYPASPG